MKPADWLNPRASWRLAFLLSAGLHGLASAALLLVPGPKTGSVADSQSPAITVCHIAEEPTAAIKNESFFPHNGGGPGKPGFGEPKRLLPGKMPATLAHFDPKVISASLAGTMGDLPEPIEPGTSGPAAAGNPAGGNPSGSSTGANGAFFGVPVQGEKIAYVIDRSSSMGRYGAMNKARAELLASLCSLPESAFFQVIVYNSTAHALIEGETHWLMASSTNVKRAAEALAVLEATRGTVHDRALPLALALQPDVIFFLTDADDLSPSYLRTITDRNHGRAVIHVIELNTANSQRPDAPLQSFARQNRGTYRAVALMR